MAGMKVRTINVRGDGSIDMDHVKREVWEKYFLSRLKSLHPILMYILRLKLMATK